MRDLSGKLASLKEQLGEMERVAVAFSGGVDSALLLQVASDVLGKNAIAATARLESIPETELDEALSFCRDRGIQQVVFDADELELDGFRDNPPDRCYLCKRNILERIWGIAKDFGIEHVVEGSNADDVCDYRPGMKALHELGVASPLLEAGFSKSDVREAARELGLEMWDKPAFSCMYTRFATGSRLAPKRLKMVEDAERFLRDMGFAPIRVRVHGEGGQPVARIEVSPADIPRLANDDVRVQVWDRLRRLGFGFVSLDMAGYKMGNMNHTQ